MKALKEQRCEREPPVDVDVDVDVDDDDFAGLACPLDDLEAVVILESETTTFDPFLFDNVKLDDHNMAIQEKPKRPPSQGKGKNLETVRLVLCAPPPSSCQQNPTGTTKSDAHHQRQDWDDEEKLENSKRKLHQGYQEFQNKRKKIQLLDVKNLPLPSKPLRGRVLSENKPLISSRKCPEPSDFSESQQNPKGSQNLLIMIFIIGKIGMMKRSWRLVFESFTKAIKSSKTSERKFKLSTSRTCLCRLSRDEVGF
ncbi:hypothetical protein Prudu_006510 [Prunus dulcis]|uniref:Uncharacterized protein n=1 Tax=Prunus dulcis TaxID=3755 RepID=A0A4Y1QZY3_PRUDU|nr:hypothetical protein Prudu_006510 [Prunus dulcis]